MLSDDVIDDARTDPGAAKAPAARQQQAGWKPEHRQPRATTATTPGDPPWWATASQAGFTAAGEQATAQSRHKKAAIGIGLHQAAKEGW